jgi:hypothetical protein
VWLVHQNDDSKVAKWTAPQPICPIWQDPLHDLDRPGRRPRWAALRCRRTNLRWLYAHMIDEYARHNGHAELIRELIDGATGL